MYNYDTRSRVISEKRFEMFGQVEVTAQDIAYEYDQGGNRTKKIDVFHDREVRYTYDVPDSSLSGTKNNRLLKSQELQSSSSTTIYSTTWYAYNCAGNVLRVITNDTATPQNYSATRFSYAANGKMVTFALQENWTWDGNMNNPVANYAVDWLREFRYEGGRQRYLNRKLNPATLAPLAGETTWTDYDGNDAYGDFTIPTSAPFTPQNQASYEPGIAMVSPFTTSGGSNTKYYHSDHLGTTRTMSTASGLSGGTRVYTAFGDRLAGPTPPDRHGYVGAHGYQTHTDLPFQHVGARYYDPSSGRFLQRDLIGISDALNTYAYVGNSPTAQADPFGLSRSTMRKEFEYFQRHPEQWRIPPGPPPPPPPRPGSREALEEELRNAQIDAWASGLMLGGVGCALGPWGWAIWAFMGGATFPL